MSGLELLLQAATVRPSLINPSNNSERKRTLSHSHSDIITPQSSLSNNNNLSRTSRCASSTSLPPKKRMKISFQVTGSSSGGNHGGRGNTNESICIQSDSSLSSLGMSVLSSSTYGSGGHTDSPSVNSEWTETMATKMRIKTNTTNRLLNISHPLVESKRSRKKDGKKNGTNFLNKKSSSHGLKRQVSSTSSLKSSVTSSKTTDELSVKDVDGNDMCMGYFSMPSRMNSSSSSSKLLTTTDARKKLPTIRDANEEETNHHRLPAQQVKVSPQRSHDANQHDTKQRLPAGNEIMYQPLLADTKTSLRGVPDRFGNATGWIEAKPLLYQAFLQALNQHQNR